MYFDLTYIVRLDGDYSIDQLTRDISVGFSGISGIKSWAENQNHKLNQYHLVSYSTLGEDEKYQLFIKFSGKQLGITEGGLSRIATIIFGNPFRHTGVLNVFLTKIDFSPDLAAYFKGPMFGIEGFNSYFHQEKFPLKSVPLPIELNLGEKQNLIKRLVMNGINIVSDSPIYNPSKQELIKDINFFETTISKQVNVPFIYFINATVILDRIFDYIKIIKEINKKYTFKIGFRICPLSVGFNTCSFMRKFNIPIYGYNLLNIAHADGGKYNISAGALTKLMRIVGCDLVNVGLSAKNILGKPVSNEIISSATQGNEQNIKQSVPVITGSLTPRTAYQVVSAYGKDIVLHVKKPLMRSGLEGNELDKNIFAFCESIELSKKKIPIDKALGKENKQTKFLRYYETKYGSE